MALTNDDYKDSSRIGSESKDYSKQIKNIQKRLKEEINLTAKERKKLEDTIAAYRWEKLQDEDENSARNRKKQIEEEHKIRMKQAEEEGNVVKKKYEESFGTAARTAETISKAVGSLTTQVDASIKSYVDKQQALTAHLVGVGNLTDLTHQLTSAMGSSTLVKQETVYNKLSDLVSRGIVYNVEQRAFLQTIADDIDATFDATNGSLTRLIRLQGQDLSANRLAIEYSLQTFLNQNYQTSEYIKDAFSDVSSALLDTQSLMSTDNGLALESTVQSYLGSLYSLGAQSNTISSLASAINELGSGNVDNLGSGISNLILMGVARAGLSYSDLINGGINASDTDTILSNVIGYLTEINGNSSNVVRSQLAKAFGVGITDLIAASNMANRGVNTDTGVTSDIYSALLNNYNGLVPLATELENIKSNAIFTWGADVASSRGQYVAYEVEKLLAGLGGELAKSTSKVLNVIGVALSAAPLVSLITSGAGKDIISSFFGSTGGFGSSAAAIFNALGGANGFGSTVKISGAGVSGSAYVGNSSMSDMLNGSSVSMNESLAEAGVVQGDEESVEDHVALINENVANIWNLLSDNLEDMNMTISNIETELSSLSMRTQGV